MTTNARPKIISIVGLTASGKSALGIKLAQEFGGEIISCDSRQVYKGLDIGTAKVTKQEQELVKHHLIDIVLPAAPGYNVFEFQKAAVVTVENIISRGKIPFLVGGSGLYSRSIVDGYVFNNITKSKSYEPKFDVLQICLLPPRDYIKANIAARIEERLAQGMLEETADLIKQGISKQFLQSLGLEYYWNIEYLDGHVTMDEYKKNLCTKSLQFAKRQRTWFKKERQDITHYLTEPENFYQDSKKLISLFLM